MQATRPCSAAGFSLVHVLVIVAILVALSAVLVPPTRPETDDVDRTRVLTDCNAIGAGLRQFMQDTGCSPCGFEGSSSYGWLRGPGAEPVFVHRPLGWVGSLGWFLTKNYMGNAKWAGPYLGEVPVDPWGRQYVVLTEGFWKDRPEGTGAYAWVLSAGEDGILQTPWSAARPVGDDLGISIP